MRSWRALGDIDGDAAELNVPVHPDKAPGIGHMGILPSGIGPEAVVRLQAGGLKVGELLSRGSRGSAHDCLQQFDHPGLIASQAVNA